MQSQHIVVETTFDCVQALCGAQIFLPHLRFSVASTCAFTFGASLQLFFALRLPVVFVVNLSWMARAATRSSLPLPDSCASYLHVQAGSVDLVLEHLPGKQVVRSSFFKAYTDPFRKVVIWKVFKDLTPCERVFCFETISWVCIAFPWSNRVWHRYPKTLLVEEKQTKTYGLVVSNVAPTPKNTCFNHLPAPGTCHGKCPLAGRCLLSFLGVNVISSLAKHSKVDTLKHV